MNRREEALARPLFATVAYAEAFGLGTIDLPEWQTALLKRSIPGTEWFDALGCYPLTVFGPEADLQAGRERLRAAGLVSVALVPDPSPVRRPTFSPPCSKFAGRSRRIT